MRVGLIGLGSMGALHLKTYAGIAGVEVAAVSSRDSRRLSGDLRDVGGNLNRDAGTHDFSNVRQYLDWRDLLKDEDLDAVDICLPSALHAPVTVAALERGKDVLCEKPMSLRPPDCEAMSRAASGHGRVLMIAQTLRFWPEYLYLADFVRDHRVVHARFTRRCAVPQWSRSLSDDAISGGAILDLLVHDIDQALLLFGVPQGVEARSLGEVDTVHAKLRYADREVEIEGGWYPAETAFAMGFEVSTEGEERLSYQDGVLKRADEVVSLLNPMDAYEAELRYFVECCVERTQPKRCLPVDSARAVQVASLLKESRIPCAL